MPEMQSRTALALGVDVIRRIASDQLVVLAGVGGLGSVMAEQLVRSGFTHVGLVDPDVLELTNLNRFAGGFCDSVGRRKVDVVREHLLRINPEARIAPEYDSVSVKKYRVPEAERTGFRVLDNCAEEHQQ